MEPTTSEKRDDFLSDIKAPKTAMSTVPITQTTLTAFNPFANVIICSPKPGDPPNPFRRRATFQCLESTSMTLAERLAFQEKWDKRWEALWNGTWDGNMYSDEEIDLKTSEWTDSEEGNASAKPVKKAIKKTKRKKATKKV